MTRGQVLAWLRARRPEPPADLAAKFVACVEAAPEAVLAGERIAAVCGALGTWLLETAVRQRKAAHDTAPDAGRPAHDTSDAPPAGSRRDASATAMDLLAADAFVTYAFEAASEEGSDVTDLADRLLSKVRA